MKEMDAFGPGGQLWEIGESGGEPREVPRKKQKHSGRRRSRKCTIVYGIDTGNGCFRARQPNLGNWVVQGRGQGDPQEEAKALREAPEPKMSDFI